MGTDGDRGRWDLQLPARVQGGIALLARNIRRDPRDDLANALSALAAARGMTYEIESWFRDHRSWRLRGEAPKAAGFIHQTPATK